MDDLYEWIHDDITWCADECSHTDCERHISNRLSKQGMFSAAMFKGTPTCPYYKEGRWVEVSGYMTPGGDPVYICSVCGKSEHVHGVEHPESRLMCHFCGSRNFYPWEKKDE